MRLVIEDFLRPACAASALSNPDLCLIFFQKTETSTLALTPPKIRSKNLKSRHITYLDASAFFLPNEKNIFPASLAIL
jgi:hypothetical protein